MTVDDVKKRINVIEEMLHDDEACHSAEDELWFDVLTAIARGDELSKDLAKEALKTVSLDFSRWCA